MDLKLVQKHWDRFGRNDPLWANLSLPGKERGEWALEEFLATGRTDIAAILRSAAERGLEFRRGRALDFGCGVGRLTQALADAFERVDGVDIAPSMIAHARELNRFGARCSYHVNDQPDLRLFGDGSFDFIYSALVLQHMEPVNAKAYIREFVRLCTPGGIAVFQVPSHRTATEPRADAASTAPTGPLSSAACRARITPLGSGGSIEAGAHWVIEATVENTGTGTWKALGLDHARYQIVLGSHWLTPDGRMVEWNGPRAPLPHDIAPGEAVTLLLGLTAPRWNGEFHLELDLVQEHVAWFAESGSPTARLRFAVTGGEPAPVFPATPRPRRPLQDRRPGLYRIVRPLGLLEARRWYRRRRDALRSAVVKAYASCRPATPVMEMNCILRTDVVATVTSAGAEVCHVDTTLLPGGFQSCLYWVRATK
jgi:SAM-dependent methyltransferase